MTTYPHAQFPDGPPLGKLAPLGGSAAHEVASVGAQVDRFIHDGLPAPEQLPMLRFDLPELQFPTHINLVEALFKQADERGHAGRPFLRSPRITFSYQQSHERVNRIANFLMQDCALAPGNRVLLRGGNSIGMALAWLAVDGGVSVVTGG